MNILNGYLQNYNMKLGGLHSMDYLDLSRNMAFRRAIRHHLDKFRFMPNELRGNELANLAEKYKVSKITVQDAIKHLYGAAVADELMHHETQRPA